MTYRLYAGEAVADGVVRVAREQLAAALRQLSEHAPGDRREAVHEARKHLKRARAALRLVRADVEPDIARAENRRLRDAGRALARLRDADVAVTTLETALCDGPAAVALRQGHQLHAWLVQRRERASAGDRETIARAGLMVATALERVDGWLTGPAGWPTARTGLRRTYRRGRTRMADAYELADAGSFHEWRKRVKDLWYQLCLLEPTWPEVLGPLSGQAHRLSELLGAEHDLSVLRALASDRDGSRADGTAALCELLDQRRGRLRVEARALGRRMYAESPGAFVDRIEAYWTAWRDESPPQAWAAPTPDGGDALP